MGNLAERGVEVLHAATHFRGLGGIRAGKPTIVSLRDVRGRREMNRGSAVAGIDWRTPAHRVHVSF